MGLIRVPIGFAAAASAAAIAACNALTGASDLELCRTSTCEEPDAGPSKVVPDAQVVDTGSKDAGTDTKPNDAAPDGFVDSGEGCQGAIACERVVFTTSGTYTGNLGGILGADLECQKAADSALAHPRVKGRSVRAWVSTAGTSASTRLPHGTLPYRSPTGQLIAASWTDLTDGSLVNGIREDERGMQQIGNVWTGTDSNGSANPENCLDWTSSDNQVKGRRGNLGANGGGWTQSPQDDCNTPNRLLCFEY